jgi:iron(III) transport system substrate-binding protein
VFQKRFPEIKVVTVSGDPVPRILAERRAGKYLADVAIGGATTPYELYSAKALDSLKDAMILPEVADESKWWQGKHRFLDPEGEHAFMFIGHPQSGGIYYNTRLVDPKEFRSFWDFLNPKWKGKIHSRDIRSPGTGTANMKVFYYNPRLGTEFIRRLYTEMDITLFRDRRQGVDWLVTGKFPICFFCTRSDIGLAKRQGLPVEEFGAMKEGLGLTSSSGNMGLVNRAPHPNAAKVFVNWFLSRDGQLTLQREYAKAMVTAANSLRVDIPKDMIPPDQRLVGGIDYIEVETPERMSMEPILKIFNEALAKAGK